MRTLKITMPIFRGMGFCGGLGLAAGALEQQLQVDKTVMAWTLFVSLPLLGVYLCLLPLELSEQNPVARWFRPPRRAGMTVSVLLGAMLIVAVIIWTITGPQAGPPLVSVVLLLIAPIGGYIGIIVIGVLAAIGWIAKGNEETKEWARSWSRTHAAPGASSPQKHAPLE